MVLDGTNLLAYSSLYMRVNENILADVLILCSISETVRKQFGNNIQKHSHNNSQSVNVVTSHQWPMRVKPI